MIVRLWQAARNWLEKTFVVTWLRRLYQPWTGKIWICALVLTLLALTLFAFPLRNDEVADGDTWKAPDGCAYTLPDGRLPPYGKDEVLDSLGSLPEKGRKIYAFSQVTLDAAFPILYALFFGAILLLLASRRDGSRVQLSFALLFPALAGLADLVENLAYSAVALDFAGQEIAALGVAATWAKIAFLLLTLVAVALTGRSRFGPWLEQLMIVRVPLLALAIFYLLVVLDWKANLPTISNMMMSKSALGLGIAVAASVVTLAVIGLGGTLAYRLTPARFRSDCNRPDCPRPEGSSFRDLLDEVPVWSVLVLLPILAFPMVCRLYLGAEGVPGRWAGILFGLVGALVPFAGLEKVRSSEFLQRRADSLLPFFRALGPGYVGADQNGAERVRRGHPLALGVTALLALLYAGGYWWLRPDGAPHAIPTVAYVLLLMAFLCQGLAGLSFFLDRYRFPLILGLVLYAVSFDLLFPQDHFFSVREAKEAAPSIGEALEARLGLAGQERSGEEPVLLTVIGASGGGIQAAAWTAQVLTGLEEALGPEFTRSIQLISSASGGSVGSLFFLESLDSSGALVETGALPIVGGSDPYKNVREAAMASSLDATAWGLVFPDFLRAFFPPIVPDGQDRAWAMEQAWLQNLACMKAGEPQDRCRKKPAKAGEQLWLTEWRTKASTGRIPGVIFNGTFVEDGEPLLISNLDLSGFDLDRRPFSATRWDYDGRTDFTLDEHYPGLPTFDLPLVTAARLSATFPYVTPVARAQWFKGTSQESEEAGAKRADQQALPRWHVADGGFFDNYGTTVALRWIEAARIELGKRGKEARVLYIQINAFPPERETPSCERKGWVFSAFGPLKTIVKVRSSTQRVRNDLELAELQGRLGALGVPFTAVSFRPPPQSTAECAEERIPEPLSWELSDANKTQVCNDWGHFTNQQKVDSLAREYFDRPGGGKPPARCPERGRSKDL